MNDSRLADDSDSRKEDTPLNQEHVDPQDLIPRVREEADLHGGLDGQGAEWPRAILRINYDDEEPARPSRGNQWLPPQEPSAWRDPEYNLEHETLSWEWFKRHGSHTASIRTIARLLRALEESGFVERLTFRQDGRPVRRVFRLTGAGVEFAELLTG